MIIANYLLKNRYNIIICFFIDIIVNDKNYVYFCSKLNIKDMYSTISADIVSSTSLSEVGAIELKQYLEGQLNMLETFIPIFGEE